MAIHTDNRMESKNAAWGGICLSILGCLAWNDIIHTVILGAVGTTVSFFVSVLLGRLFKKKKRITKAVKKFH